MIARSLLLLIPLIMYLVCKTEGCGRGDWKVLEKYWLEEELTQMTDMKMPPEAVDEFLKLIYSKPQYRQLQDEIDQFRSIMEKELAKKLAKQNRRKREGMFRDFKHTYTEMHRDMTKFILKLLRRLKRSGPAEAKNLKPIVLILPPNGAFFDIKHTNLVLELWEKTVVALKLVLESIDRYVTKKHLVWFEEQKGKFERWIYVVNGYAELLRKKTTFKDEFATAPPIEIDISNRGTADLQLTRKLKKKVDVIIKES
ncbi:hypothetical protein BgiMline_003514 [Biomphalaria glabrata]|nr:hypothetical protein BgiBS90_006486 [Biomphalaria glabrata]